MIYACPICGSEDGVTHGDQYYVRSVCDECLADDKLMAWWHNYQREKIEQRIKKAS